MPSITLDTRAATQPRDELFRECVGSCHAYLTLREDWREHTREIQRHIGFRHIRFHNLFSELVGVCARHGDGPILHNFQNVEKIYDFLLAQGARPFVELGFMPNLLASDPSKRLFQYAANVSPPKNQSDWAALVRALAIHCIERYGRDEVLRWPFEVWNEPDLQPWFWSATQADYFQLYATTARALKEVDDRIQVGGPATSKSMWIKDTLGFCAENRVPLDFISTHHYCVDVAIIMDKPEGDIFYRGQKQMAADVRRVGETIRASAFPKAKLHFTEWNVSPAHEDLFGKDTEFTAAFVLETLKDMRDLADSYSLWTLNDIFEESGPGLAPFSGKYGLLNLHGIPKPVFHAFDFLARLHPEEIQTTAQSLHLTRAASGALRLLTWNHVEPTTTDYTGKDYTIPDSPRTDTLTLTGLTSGPHRVRAWLVDRTHGNATRQWQRDGSPQYLNASQITHLKAAAEPALVRDEIQHGPTLTLTHTLAPSGILFYDIAPAISK